MRTEKIETLIVGSGPAGMSAAITIARHGGSAVIVDEQPDPGGQIYRGAEGATERDVGLFGNSYARGVELIAQFRESGSDYRPRTTVVNIDHDLNIDLVCNGVMTRAKAQSVIVATGAYERPVPVDGWTLPGVMTAGAAQVLAKQSGIAPGGRVVLVGSGALLWLWAWQCRQMDVNLTTIIELNTDRRSLAALRHIGGFLGSNYWREGLKYLLAAKRHTRILRARGNLMLEGEHAASGVVFDTASGTSVRVEADTVLLHDGVIPNVHLSGAAGCKLRWSPSQKVWQPEVDSWQRSLGRAGIYIAGDGASIQGAASAEATGAIAALDALHHSNSLTESERDQAALEWRAAHKRHLKGRSFIDTWFPPVESVRFASAETLVCRCEAVTLQAAEQAIRQQTNHLAHLKAMTRCGMGPCQGRMCMPSIGSLSEHKLGVEPTHFGPPSCRFPTKPLSVAMLAGFGTDEKIEAGQIRE